MTNIVLGDCTKELKKIESNTVDLIIADPPYNVGKDYGNKSDKQDFDEYSEEPLKNNYHLQPDRS